jgi:hypothetical protein
VDTAERDVRNVMSTTEMRVWSSTFALYSLHKLCRRSTVFRV